MVPVEEPSGWCRGAMMKYFLENQRVLGFQSHAGGGWWLLGTRWGEGGCLVGSGLALDAPLSGDAGLAGGLPAQEAAPAAPPTAFQNNGFTK